MESVKSVFRSFEKHTPDDPVCVRRLPDDVATFAAEYPSLANEFYAVQAPCAPPFDVRTVKALAASRPRRKPKGAVLDSAALALAPIALAPISRKQEGLMASFMMNVMKMMQGGKKEPLINVYEGRNSMKSALECAPPALADRMNDGVRTVGTTQWSMPPLMSNADSPVDPESQSPSGGDLIAEKKVPVEDAKVPIEEPVAKVPVKDAKGVDARGITATVLEALLERNADKKKEQALKTAEKRRQEVEKRREAAAAVLKRPAAATKSGEDASSEGKK